jgi:hypothetical protein
VKPFGRSLSLFQNGSNPLPILIAASDNGVQLFAPPYEFFYSNLTRAFFSRAGQFLARATNFAAAVPDICTPSSLLFYFSFKLKIYILFHPLRFNSSINRSF